MVAPDHWVPLMVVSSRMNYSPGKTYLNAAALGALHAITSEALAAMALVVGVFLVKSFLHYVELASVILLVAVGVYFIINGYTEDNPEGEYPSSSIRSIIAISAFPDFALIPIMLAGSSLPATYIAAVMLVFILISALSLALVAVAAAGGASKALQKIPPRYIDYIMGIVLFITSAILAFVPL